MAVNIPYNGLPRHSNTRNWANFYIRAANRVTVSDALERRGYKRAFHFAGVRFTREGDAVLVRTHNGKTVALPVTEVCDIGPLRTNGQCNEL